MKPLLKYGKLLLIGLLYVTIACEGDDAQGPEDFYDQGDYTIVLDATKAPGTGQYRAQLESNDTLHVNVNVKAPEELRGIQVTKTRNLTVDTSFGTAGTRIIEASGTAFDFDFTYYPSVDDVDQLIGFTFEAMTASDKMHTSDLTAVITLSPKDNLTRKDWLWTSIKHVNSANQPNEEVIAECERDNIYSFNEDGSMSLDYGGDTGSGSCNLDGLNVYSKWRITDVDQYFLLEKYNVFTPNITAVDTFEIVELKVERLQLLQKVDLSVFGLGIEEFLYTFQPQPKN